MQVLQTGLHQGIISVFQYLSVYAGNWRENKVLLNVTYSKSVAQLVTYLT